MILRVNFARNSNLLIILGLVIQQLKFNGIHDNVIKWKHFPPVPGEFPSQRPVTRSLIFYFHLRLNKRLSKQSRSWWFETLSRPLWCHCKVHLWFALQFPELIGKLILFMRYFDLIEISLALIFYHGKCYHNCWPGHDYHAAMDCE